MNPAVLRGLITAAVKQVYLSDPVHLELVSNGQGEYPNGYKLTDAGIARITEAVASKIEGATS